LRQSQQIESSENDGEQEKLVLEYDYYSLTFFAFYKHELDEVGTDTNEMKSMSAMKRITVMNLDQNPLERQQYELRLETAKKNERHRKYLKKLQINEILGNVLKILIF